MIFVKNEFRFMPLIIFHLNSFILLIMEMNRKQLNVCIQQRKQKQYVLCRCDFFYGKQVKFLRFTLFKRVLNLLHFESENRLNSDDNWFYFLTILQTLLTRNLSACTLAHVVKFYTFTRVYMCRKKMQTCAFILKVQKQCVYIQVFSSFYLNKSRS